MIQHVFFLSFFDVTHHVIHCANRDSRSVRIASTLRRDPSASGWRERDEGSALLDAVGPGLNAMMAHLASSHPPARFSPPHQRCTNDSHAAGRNKTE